MIIVTGATGQLGRLVIDALLETVPASNIVAAVRNPDKATDLAARGVVVRKADYSQPETLDSALAGAEKLLLISSSEVGQRVPQHRAVIEAAKRAGVRLIAYTSILRADTSSLSLAAEHVQTEALLKASGLPFVLLRNGWYTENYAVSVSMALAAGKVLGSAGDGRISSAARSDYAAAAAQALTRDNQAGRVYELAGDASFTLTELAAEIALQSGKPIAYKNLPEADYKAALIEFGLPETVASLIAGSDAAISKGALFDEGHHLSALIERLTTPMADTIATVVRG